MFKLLLKFLSFINERLKQVEAARLDSLDRADTSIRQLQVEKVTLLSEHDTSVQIRTALDGLGIK